MNDTRARPGPSLAHSGLPRPRARVDPLATLDGRDPGEEPTGMNSRRVVEGLPLPRSSPASELLGWFVEAAEEDGHFLLGLLIAVFAGGFDSGLPGLAGAFRIFKAEANLAQ
jgi:hypothetical protein